MPAWGDTSETQRLKNGTEISWVLGGALLVLLNQQCAAAEVMLKDVFGSNV